MKTSPLIRVGLAALVVALVGVTLMGAGRARAAVLDTISQGTYNSNGFCFYISDCSIGQSFTVGATGVITIIRLAPSGAGASNLQIYAGAGNAGALLHSQAVSWVPAGGAFQTVTLTSPVPVTAGGVYTVYAGFRYAGGTVFFSSRNPYGEGQWYTGANPSSVGWDLKFEVVIEDAPVTPPAGVDTCADGRINCRGGDDYATIYRASDSEGDPALHVYCLDAAGNGALAEALTQDDFDSAPAHPVSNSRVATITGTNCRVPISAWVLTTGEYQIVIGPDYKGDMFRIIFTGLPPAGIYTRRCNVITSPALCNS